MSYMLLAALITVGSMGLLVAMGWLTHNLLGNHAEQWAKALIDKRDEPNRRR